MGTAQSSGPEPRAPWLPLQEGKIYQPSVEDATAHCFLEANPAFTGQFVMENELPHVQGALNYDSRIANWLPRLVPKRVTEEVFWCNYFSHVKPITAKAAVVDDPAAAAAAAVAGAAASPHSDRAVAATPTKPGPAAGAAGAASAGGMNGAQRLVASTAAGAGAAAPGAGATRLTAQTAALGGAGAAAIAGGAGSGSVTGVKQGQEVKERKASLPEVPWALDEKKLGGPIRWGIIGCGDVTEDKSGPAFQKCKGSQLVAVMRRTPSLAKDYAHRHGVPRYYTQASSLIRDAEVDAVYIATPPGTHLQYALEVLAAGKPCYVEKPMARTADECTLMIEEFARAGVPLYVAYYRRAQPKFLQVKLLLQQGHLGTVTQVNYAMARGSHLRRDALLKWRTNAEQAGGGLFVDLGSHVLDLMDFFFGPLCHVQGDAVSIAAAADVLVETGVAMTFRTQQGALGSASWNFSSAVDEDLFTISGTKGSLSFSVFGKDFPVLRSTGADGKAMQSQYPVSFPEHVQQPLIQEIVDELRVRAAGIVSLPRVPSTGESAKRTSQVIDAVLRKFYKNRNDEFWTRPQSWQAALPGRPAGAPSALQVLQKQAQQQQQQQSQHPQQLQQQSLSAASQRSQTAGAGAAGSAGAQPIGAGIR